MTEKQLSQADKIIEQTFDYLARVLNDDKEEKETQKEDRNEEKEFTESS